MNDSYTLRTGAQWLPYAVETRKQRSPAKIHRGLLLRSGGSGI